MRGEALCWRLEHFVRIWWRVSQKRRLWANIPEQRQCSQVLKVLPDAEVQQPAGVKVVAEQRELPWKDM